MKQLIRAIGVIFGIFLVGAGAQAMEYNLWSVQSGKYVNLFNGTLAANTNDPDLALRIKKIDLGGGRWALFDVGANKYIRAGVGPNTLLAPLSPHVRGWETFEIRNEGRDRHSIKSVQNGKYVRAGVGASSLLAAVSQSPAGWEHFRFIPAPDLNSPLQSGSYRSIDGSYSVTHVAAENGFLVRLGPELARAAWMQIDREGRISATAGCNRISANLRQNDNWITTPDNQVIITRVGCADRSIHNTELGIYSAIRDVQEFTRTGDNYLFKGNGKDLMIIRRDR